VTRLDYEKRARALANAALVLEARRLINRYAGPGAIVVEANRHPLKDPALTSIPKSR
jgi:hypothetical protein